MPPRSQRSRACNQCRERRVKCDETPEVCAQCRRLGLLCSGPIQGSVIIDMTARVAKQRQRKKKKETKPNAAVRKDSIQDIPVRVVDVSTLDTAEDEPRRTTSPSAVPSSSQHHGPGFPPLHEHALQLAADRKLYCRSQKEAEESLAAIRNALRLPVLYQPSKMRTEALDIAFTSHFVALNKCVRPYSPEVPWLTHLPKLHDKVIKPALKLSIRAASMACYAKVHRDPTILVDSYRWYTASLNCQRLSLERIGRDEVPSAEEILVPVILGLYEVYAGTTSTSVFHHLSGAVKILEMRGPEGCRSGMVWCVETMLRARVQMLTELRPLFKAMRVSDAHKALIFCQPSIFSTNEWMTIPFVGQARNAHQYLTDMMLAIPNCIKLCGIPGNLRDVFSTPLSSGLDRRPVRESALKIIQDLDDWAVKHPNLTTATPGNHYVVADPTSLATSGALLASPDSPFVVLPDSFISMTIAGYEALRLVLHLLLDKLETDPDGFAKSPNTPTSPLISPVPSLVDHAMMSSKAIIETAAYIESTHPVGFDLMRSVFPLVIVALLGPRDEEKGKAREMLDRWGKKKGMAGLTSAWIHV